MLAIYLHNPAGGWQLQTCSEAGAEMCPPCPQHPPGAVVGWVLQGSALQGCRMHGAGCTYWVQRCSLPCHGCHGAKPQGREWSFSTSWQVKVNCRGESRVYLGLQTCQNDRVLCFHLDCSTLVSAEHRQHFVSGWYLGSSAAWPALPPSPGAVAVPGQHPAGVTQGTAWRAAQKGDGHCITQECAFVRVQVRAGYGNWEKK